MKGRDIRADISRVPSTDVSSGLSDGPEPEPTWRDDPKRVARVEAAEQQGRNALQQEEAMQSLGRRTITAIDAANLLEGGYEWMPDPYDLEDHQNNIVVEQQVGAHLRQSQSDGENFAWNYVLRQAGHDPLRYDAEEDPEEAQELIELTDHLIALGSQAAVADAEQDLATSQQQYAEAQEAEKTRVFTDWFARNAPVVNGDEAKRARAVEKMMNAVGSLYGGDQSAALAELFALEPQQIVQALDTVLAGMATEQQAGFRHELENTILAGMKTDISTGLSMNGIPATGVPYKQFGVEMSDLEAVMPDRKGQLTQAEVFASLARMGQEQKQSIQALSEGLYRQSKAASDAKAAKGRR